MSGVHAALVDGREGMAGALAERWLAYGDGLFETLRAFAGKLPLWPAHLQRLMLGCERLQLPMPDASLLERELAQLLARFPNSVIKLIVGAGGLARGYAREPGSSLRRAMLVFPAPPQPAHLWRDGLRVCWCETRIAYQSRLAGIKHLNRLEQVLARAEWSDTTIAEGLMQGSRGEVLCATGANVFAVIDGVLCTPSVTEAGVAGVMRGEVLRLAASDMPTLVAELSVAELQNAQEIFLTNAVRGVRPVGELADRRLAIGPVARHLYDRLIERGFCP